MSDYYAGLNEKLYAAIPPSQKVLELGCAQGRLGQKYKESNPQTIWTGVDISPEALSMAAQHLDNTYQMDLDTEALDPIGSGFDCVVVGDLFEHLKRPERLLEALLDVSTPEATLVCCVPNMGHISVMERMLVGDISYDDEGLLDRTHLRFYSAASLLKLLLDSGWFPTVRDFYVVGHSNRKLAEKLLEGAQLLGVPQRTAQRFLFTYQTIFVSRKSSLRPESTQNGPITVVVPVTNELQVNLNVIKSPGLHEIGAQVLLCYRAQNAAGAFEWGAGQASHPWVIFCHQDVYFPKGSGYAISALLSRIPASEVPNVVIGFAGLSVDPNGAVVKSGLLVDRITLFDHTDSDAAISLDEFAVVMARNSRFRIDPGLGWHLWATDLCLQAQNAGAGASARVVRVPLFHNSYNDGSLPDAFRASTERLVAKYPDVDVIHTLCGDLRQHR